MSPSAESRMRIRTSALPPLSACLLLAACAATPESPPQRRQRAAELAVELARMSPQTSAAEARAFSRQAVETCADLRSQYHIQLAHNLHNVLVYWGLKNRGYCWHWQVDLDQALSQTDHPDLVIHRIVASPGSLWHEHHALSVTAPGAAWNDGLVLDPWREEGLLWFGPVKTDRFPWQQEP